MARTRLSANFFIWLLLAALLLITSLVSARGSRATVDGVNITQCSVDGNVGQCMDSASCQGLPSFTPVPGYCPNLPDYIQCCVLTPSLADNPPLPAGWVLMQQAAVTPDMTQFAVDILHDPTDFPMFAHVLGYFKTVNATSILPVMGRVEWHPPDFNNEVIHRGVTLYQPQNLPGLRTFIRR
jgi:hypothetical protein